MLLQMQWLPFRLEVPMAGEGNFGNAKQHAIPESTCSASESLQDESTGFILVDELPPQFVEATSRYEILEELGSGGMGRVFRARDLDLNRDVALKILLQSLVSNPRASKQFTEEAQIIGSLQHPGIAQVYEVGHTDDGRPFHTMKLVEGNTMYTLLRERSTDEHHANRLLHLFSQVCQTMAYTHAQGVIHLDLKPANIMVGAFGEVHVMDWGLAHVLHDGPPFSQRVGSDTDRSQTAIQLRSVRGTLEYMAPEQAQVGYLDRRTDVFCLGAILCEILTGLPPYVGKDRDEYLAKAKEGNLQRAFDQLNDCDCAVGLSRLATRCLQPDPDQRPADASELAREMNLYLDSRRKRAEDDMTRFFELSLDLFCIAGTDGYFRRVNQNFTKVLGYSEDELLSTPFLDFVIPEDRDETVGVMKQLIQGQPVIRFRNRYRTRNGDVIQFEWTAKSLPHEKQIFAVARQVT